MTNYLYSLSLADQTIGFLFALGFGFVMGFFYDLFRIVRITISKSKKIFVTFDLIYFIFLSFSSYLFFLTINEGDVRAFLVLGEIAGFGIYYFSLGVVIFSASEKIVGAIKLILAKTFKIIFIPFSWTLKKTRVIINKISKKWVKNGKKVKNKSKFHLKLHKHLLYNLIVKMVKTGVSQEKEV